MTRTRDHAPHSRGQTFRLLRVAAALGLAICTGWGGAVAAAPPSATPAVDFDAALLGLKFDPSKVDGNLDATGKANGIPDAVEMALAAAILNDPAMDLSGSGGVTHAEVRAAFDQALASATIDVRPLAATYPTAATVVVGYALLGEGSFQAFGAMTNAFGAPLKGGYGLARGLGRYLAADGDADGDGVSNRSEYAATIKQGRTAYLRAALDPAARESVMQPPIAAAPKRKTVGVVLYPGFEVLDVFGPVEMWANVPDFEVVLIAERAGLIASAQGVEVNAGFGFEDAPKLDILMVPGGVGTAVQLENPRILKFLQTQDQHTQFTTSVCTGSALLAKAGLLRGRRATSNKAFFSLATSQDASVTWVKQARWVEDGKMITSSGVSAGTDMALAVVARIYGVDRARQLARSLEYIWSEESDHDPFALP